MGLKHIAENWWYLSMQEPDLKTPDPSTWKVSPHWISAAVDSDSSTSEGQGMSHLPWTLKSNKKTLIFSAN